MLPVMINNHPTMFVMVVALKMEILTEKFAERGLKLRKGRWTVQEKKRLNDNFVDFVHQYEEEIGDPTDFATKSENKSRAWEVRR